MPVSDMITTIVALVTVFGTVFGIAYLYLSARNRERLAMIEKGVSANIFKKDPNRLEVLKWALLIIGGGLGLLVGNVIGTLGLLPVEAAVFSMILICGGLGLLVYYLYANQFNTSEQSYKHDVVED